MKQKISLIGVNLLALVLLLWPMIGGLMAQTGPNAGGFFKNPLNADSFPELLGLILNAVTQVGIVVVTFFIIYAGFLFVKAQGNPDGLKSAKEAIKWTIIGSAIVLGAYAIKEIIYNTVSGLTTGL